MISIMIFLAAFLVGILPPGTHARECFTNDTLHPYGHHELVLTNLDQLLALDGCTTLIGNIFIPHGFSGSLVLNSVSNFSGQIYDYTGSHALDTIEMRNLQYIDNISLYTAWDLKSVQMPRLERIKQHLLLMQGAEESWMDFTALKSAHAISVAGFFTNVSFPSLETVTTTMAIYTDPSRKIGDQSNPVDIDLPALTQVRNIEIKGHVRSLSTPKLEILGTPETVSSGKPASQGGMTVIANYTDLSGVFLPSLRELHGDLRLEGHISAIDLTGIQASDATITVKAQSPVEIYSSLEEAGWLYLLGDIAVINFTNLTSANGIYVESPTKLECPENLIHTYRTVYSWDNPSFCNDESLALAGEYTLTPTPTASPSTSSTPTPILRTPTPTPGSGGGKLSSAAEAVIVVVGILAGCFMIGGFTVARWKRKHPQKTAATPVSPTGGTADTVRVPDTTLGVGDADATEDELPRHSADEAPPPYSREPPAKGMD